MTMKVLAQPEKRCKCGRRLKWNPLWGVFDCEDPKCGRSYKCHQGQLEEVTHP